MTTAPRWEAVDDEQASLLSLVAEGSISTGTADREWIFYLDALARAADDTGVVDPNRLRELVRGVVAPQRCGAFVHRALSQGLMVPHGWVVSSDRQGGNAGRPARSYRLAVTS